jgi:hypothetical protein
MPSIKANVDIRGGNILSTVRKKRSKSFVISSNVLQLIGLFFVFNGSLGSTTISAIWTSGYAVIAVDSKITLDGDGAVKYGTTCKVIRRGPAVYVPNGLGFGHGFNLLDTMGRIGNLSTPNVVIDRLSKDIVSGLQNVVPILKVRDPVRYDRFSMAIHC